MKENAKVYYFRWKHNERCRLWLYNYVTFRMFYCIDNLALYDNGQGSSGQGGGQDDSKEGGYETPSKGHNGGWSFYEG